MAKRITEKQKNKIIADYIETGSYRIVARKYNVAPSTVKRLVDREPEIKQKATQKKDENTADMLDYMENRKKRAQKIIDTLMDELQDSDKLDKAKLSEVATALGIVIDKFIGNPAKNELDRTKLELELAKVEIQLKETVPEETVNDNFLEAFGVQCPEIWEDCRRGGADSDKE